MKGHKEEITRTRKVALYLYLNVTHPFYTVDEVKYTDHDEHWNKLPEGELREIVTDSKARLSEPVQIAFTAVTSDEQLRNAVAALDAAERTAIEELNKKISEIRSRKSQLLALTHQPEEA